MVYTNKYKNPLMNSDGGVVIRGFFVSLFPYFLISFYSIYSFSFQIFLLSDAFACFAIAFQYLGAGDRLAGTVVEIYLLIALA